MKKVINIMVIAAIALLSIACEKYDDGRPAKDVRSEFNRMYPEAKDIEWEWDGLCWEVSFEMGTRPNVIEYESWYEKSGNWLRTKSERLIANIPQQIKDYLAQDSKYGTATFADNDVDFIETPEGNFYRFDLLVGGVVVEVDVTLNGNITPVR